VAEAWNVVSADKEAIMRGFAKAGIAVATDGSENHLINIKGLPDYRPGNDKGKVIINDDYPILTAEQRELENEESLEEMSFDQWNTIREQAIKDHEASDTDYDD